MCRKSRMMMVASGRGAEEDDVDHEKIQLTPADGDDDDERLRTWTEMRKWREEHPAPGRALSHWYTVCQTGYLIRDEPSISLPPREESCLPLGRGCVLLLPPSHEVGESSAAGAARQDRPTIARDDPYSIAREDLYGFVDMVDVPPRCSTSRELDYGITDAWDDLDAQDDWSQLRAEVILLYKDSACFIVIISVMIDERVKMAREAWGLSMDASDYAFSDVMSLRTTVVAQVAERTTDTDGRVSEAAWKNPRAKKRRYCSLATRDATRNGNDSHTSGMGARRPVQWLKRWGCLQLKQYTVGMPGHNLIRRYSTRNVLHGGNSHRYDQLLIECPCNAMDDTKKDYDR
ncbi:hypothetical protein Tco_0195842 [Tanacetum coccineum]